MLGRTPATEGIEGVEGSSDSESPSVNKKLEAEQNRGVVTEVQ